MMKNLTLQIPKSTSNFAWIIQNFKFLILLQVWANDEGGPKELDPKIYKLEISKKYADSMMGTAVAQYFNKATENFEQFDEMLPPDRAKGQFSALECTDLVEGQDWSCLHPIRKSKAKSPNERTEDSQVDFAQSATAGDRTIILPSLRRQKDDFSDSDDETNDVTVLTKVKIERMKLYENAPTNVKFTVRPNQRTESVETRRELPLSKKKELEEKAKQKEYIFDLLAMRI